jgi:putative ABC transport system substrate-binding protein
MQRREFIAGLGSAAAWPVVAQAQQDGRVRRIAVLMPNIETDSSAKEMIAAFRQGLSQFGWLEGRSLRLDLRFSGGSADRFPIVAREAVAEQPEVIMVNSGPFALAVQRETRTIPVVFTSVSDPIGAGLVASLARPGGNFTGLLLMEASITGKWMGMLKEIAPRLTRAALVGNPKTMPYDFYVPEAERSARALGLELVQLRVETAIDHERGFESFARQPNGGLVLPPDSTGTTHRYLIAELAARYRLPAVYANRTFIEAGGLIAYTTDRLDHFRQSASYVDRILKGEKPADLPVMQPTKYELLINLRAAKALGLTVPETLLATADEVIQ